MAHIAPALPTRFPCWVRATYSWGGESKKDLGFVEGDLIECLNAGDGSWWMGRLRRDKRAMGLFPSNFVKVLDESFHPVSRASSPMPSPNGSLSSPKTSPQKSKTFRRPFQAYVELGPKTTPPKPSATVASALQPISRASPKSSRHTSSQDQNPPSREHNYRESSATPTRQLSFLQGPESPSRQPSYLQTTSSPTKQRSHVDNRASPTRQPSYLDHASRPVSPNMHPQNGSHTRQASYLGQSKRPASPNPYPHDGSRAPSPAPPVHYGSRAPSPAPPVHYGSRAPSPAPFETYRPSSSFDNGYEDVGSSPPPPPPPHRVAYNNTRPPSRSGPSPTPSMNDRYPNFGRGPSPAPTSPAPHSPIVPGMTPSPLRDAMDDVMSSLEGMAMRRHEHSPSPEEEKRETLDPWSPEAFEELRTKPHARSKQRPRSSLGIAPSQSEHDYDEEEYQRHIESEYKHEPPQLHDFVERMENGLRNNGAASPRPADELFFPDNHMGPPMPPPKQAGYQARPLSSQGPVSSVSGSISSRRGLRNRKSAYELGRSMLDRTFTNKSTTTNSSSGVQSVATNGTSSTDRTGQSVMSGHSAGGFSATSAGSLAKRKWGSIRGRRPQSVIDIRQEALRGLNESGDAGRPQTPSHYSNNVSRPPSRGGQSETGEDFGGLGGLMTPKKKKSGFFKKLVESAKTGAASARGTIASGQVETPRSPIKNMLPNGVTAIAGGSAARDMGLGGGKSGHDWVQVRRDVNRSNSLSRNEKLERIEKCQMMDYPVIAAVDVLLEDAEGDESMDGHPIRQPIDFQSVNLQLVDKSARFVNSLPPMTNPTSLAQGYVCRPYRSDVQKLRAIFTWVSEKVAWEEDFEGDVDARRVIQMRRGCSEEVAVLVCEMCSAVGLHAEVVRGFLKSADDIPNGDTTIRPNHWWNAVSVDGSWRMMDCSLASPTNPRRSHYSSASSQAAETGFFLARPMEICYTHIPSHYAQQHIVPPIPTDILLALPCACPSYFKNSLQMLDYDTSLLRMDNLELVHIQFTAPSDIECVANVEARSYAHDIDGDVFESGDTTTTRALAQADWTGGQKRYTIKAHLPAGDGGGQGILKVYAGKRGLMHSIKDNPHPLAFALPILHQGTNPPYEFLLRHPTPHAQRHDLYVAQPQCRRLAINNTFVFAIRQHPSSLSVISPNETPQGGGGGAGGRGAASPLPFARPSSAMSMLSSATGSNAGSDYFSQASSGAGGSSGAANQKPAKLAIQSPSGKILRLMRKSDNCVSSAEAGDGGVWETIIKVGERGVWRGLVLADRSARWCVFGEWECV